MPPTTAFNALAGVLQSGATANGAGTTAGATGLGGAWLQVSGASLNMTLTVNGTVDGNMKPLPVVNANNNPPSLTSSLGSLPATAGLYWIPLGGVDQFQCVISGYSSGTVTVTWEGIPGEQPFDIPVSVTGTLGNVNAVLTGTTGNGLSKAKPRDLGAVVSVKASAGTLYGLHVENNQGATAWVQVFDVASGSVTLGTTVPDYELKVAANSSGDLILPALGAPFGTAISIASTTAEKGNTGSSAGVQAFATYQ
ncbi:MAG: hypothetical protein KGL39_10785 [Patescibacteria group bacterium]|nr:hypothetical protein [Patescibacteria group bacterium]